MSVTKDLDLITSIIERITRCLRPFWTGIPQWLRNLLVVVVLTGCVYFLYSRFTTSQDVESLRDEIAELNEKCNTTVFYDRYIYDISNLIDATQNLEYKIDLLYDYHNELSELIIEYIQSHHPDVRIKQDLENIKKRIEAVKNTYDKVIRYEISLYDEWKPVPKRYDKTLTPPTDSIQ